MKKIMIALLALSLATSLFADKKGRTKLQIEMQKFAAGMDLLQKGILYNCKECLDDGSDRILENIKVLEKVDVKHFLPENQKYAYKFAQKTARLIEMYAKDIKESFAKGNMDDVMNDHAQILRQCNSCHIRIRGW
ncbi:hypothetical protein NitYY0826_C0020 [Nitratiruptor sp. YY08-26]|uniref:hypothetical protein n=1 Tax=unclassified Nitratiruptor TaxID=2624044 RepID=UPI00191578FF|nr:MULTISPECIES: hypothetical protein [unclassified Nitratiruptor]BCD61187.1 hypothetical protein NitYY0813_C0020 [Nitratiruptor sp. YY08-13]BCD65120.1 hypothetical protein NitYY0826_C0020 [Nitratiruptor sp. YY08-26]